MNRLEWLRHLQQMSDRELQQFAEKNKLTLTLDEIQKLRKILKHANISWAIVGVPKDVLQKLKKLLGQQRFLQLMKIVGL